MQEKVSDFIKKTAKNFKQWKQVLNRLKEEHKESGRMKAPVSEVKGNKREEIVIHFSLLNLTKATIVVLSLMILSRFLSDIASILLIFFIAILFSSALMPTVNALEKRKIPRPLGILAIYIILILILGFFISQLIPLVATQLIELAGSLSSIVEKISQGNLNIPFEEKLRPLIEEVISVIDRELLIEQIKGGLEGLSAQLKSIAGDTFGAIKTIFSSIFNFVMVLILTFFLVVNHEDVNRFFVSLFPSKHGQYIVEKIDVIQEKIGYWLRGQVILMVLMFMLSLLGLLILGIDNALTLAMMTGIAELLPVVGPIAAGIPAVLVAFNESPWLALWMLGLILLLQQIEGNILVPLVMRKAVGLSPIIIILAMMIGLNRLGVVGMIMAIPVATLVSIFVREYAEKKK